MRYVPIRLGARRVKRFFAFFPVTLNERLYNNRSEVRWLTFVTVEQIRYRAWWGGHLWDNIQFIDDIEEYTRLSESVARILNPQRKA